ncbi:HD domain-containing protein [Sphingobacterium puteale]|uniref:HD domain-containing protein n=1 Tax=Sphingobacterium puteale TaxID=2420510 RepID=UPI003D99B60E
MRAIYFSCLEPYTDDIPLLESCWNEITASYSDQRRGYHTLAHLQHFSRQLDLCKHHLSDYPTAYLALIYHDIVYFMLDGTNEEKSALVAVDHLRRLNYPSDLINTCQEMILATKTHSMNSSSDINYFIDADMSILGADKVSYAKYVAGIRKEYGDSIYFDEGRKHVLQSFLEMERIFKTDFFYKKYEEKARLNIQNEIEDLS